MQTLRDLPELLFGVLCGQELLVGTDDLVARLVELGLQLLQIDGLRDPALAVDLGKVEHLADIPVCVVVREDAACDVGLAAGGGEIARRRIDRIGRVPRICDPVTVGVDAPAQPGRRHELHPAHGTGRARPHVLAEVGLDLVDRGEDLPGDSVGGARLLPEDVKGRERHLLGAQRRRREGDGNRDRAGRIGQRRARQGDADKACLCAGRDGETEHGRTRRSGRAGQEGEADGRNDEEAHQSPAWARRSDGSSSSGSRSRSRSSSAFVCFSVAATSAFCCFSECSSKTRKSWRFVAALAATSWSTWPETTRSMSAVEKDCMSKNDPSAIASVIDSGWLSRMRSAMRVLVTITSTAAMRPPSMRGMRRWLTMPRRTPAMIERIICCFPSGKNSTMRPIVSAASTVWSVEKTRWPDSAACSAVCAVSASRSSPIRITSGSWRSARRSAPVKSGVSSPTSRWLTMHEWSLCTISIGSSIVTMCCCRVLLM